MSGDGDPITGCSTVGDNEAGVGTAAAGDHFGNSLVGGVAGMGGHDGQAVALWSDVGGDGLGGADRVVAGSVAGDIHHGLLRVTLPDGREQAASLVWSTTVKPWDEGNLRRSS